MVTELRFQQQGGRPTCAVLGCTEFPGVTQYGPLMCSAHAREFQKTLSERAYQAFLQILREHKVEGLPTLYPHNPDEPDEDISCKRECSIPKCSSKDAAIGYDFFAPYKPGRLFLCGPHRALVDQLEAQNLRERLLGGWPAADAVKSIARKKAASRRATRSHPSQLSYADAERLGRIGRQQIETQNNVDLWLDCRRVEEQLRRTKQRPRITYQAFRVSLNRIRDFEELPSSSDLKKNK